MQPDWKVQLKCHPCSCFTSCPLQCSDTENLQSCLRHTHTHSFLLTLSLLLASSEPAESVSSCLDL